MLDPESRTLKLSQGSVRKKPFAFCCVIAVVVSAFIYAEIDLAALLAAGPDFIRFFVSNFLPPSFDNIGTYLPLILQTIMFAVTGTYISAVLAFFFGLLLSEKTNPVVWLRMTVLAVMSFLRNVPVLVWTALLVYIFGIGNMVGLIALVLATLGFLSRSYAESINQIPNEKFDALKASGASYLQVLFHGIIPAFIPSWLNWTLFSFEINIRASAVLGMVGAGGIGIMIQTNIRLFRYHEALSLVIILTSLVLLTEFITNKLRAAIK